MSGLFLLITSFDYKNDSVASAASHPADFISSFIGARWHMADFKLEQAIDLDGDGHLDTNLMSFLRPCDLDNTLVFKSNGTISVDEGELKCDRTDSTMPKLGNWNYDKATNSLSILNSDGKKVAIWKIIDSSDKYVKVNVTSLQAGPSLAATVIWKTL